MEVYLASPLGFSLEWKSYRDKIKRRLTELGCKILDPWNPKFHNIIEEARAIHEWPARVAAFRYIARQIGKANEEMIRACDVVLGVLDGPELDSGTVSEIGFAAGLGRSAMDCARISATAATLTEYQSICKCFIGLKPAAGSCSEGLMK